MSGDRGRFPTPAEQDSRRRKSATDYPHTEIYGCPTDVGDRANVDDVVAEVFLRFGGSGHPGQAPIKIVEPIFDFDPAGADRVMDIPSPAAVVCGPPLFRVMHDRGGAVVIKVPSQGLSRFKRERGTPTAKFGRPVRFVGKSFPLRLTVFCRRFRALGSRV